MSDQLIWFECKMYDVYSSVRTLGPQLVVPFKKVVESTGHGLLEVWGDLRPCHAA